MTTNKPDSTKPTQHSTRNDLMNYILIFFTCAFIGWLWEVAIFIVTTGKFVNRGVLHGPWLPIYGFGGLGIALFLQRFKKYPLVVFFASLIGCGLMEYLTAWYLETFKHLKWWDYSNQFLNLDGRICFSSVFCFGLCGLGITYILYPALVKLFNCIPYQFKKSLCAFLLLCFLVDFIYSSDVPNTGEGITDEVKEFSSLQR